MFVTCVMEFKMKRLCLAIAGVLALTGAAAAADLSQPPPRYYPPASVAVPLYSWTGFYFGINGGGAFGSSSWDSTGSRDVSGGLVGAQLGYNYQAGHAVFGVEGDLDWTDINGSTNNTCSLGCKTSNTWLSTVRGRLGYAADRFMPFVTGGAAFGNVRAFTPGFRKQPTTAPAGRWAVGLRPRSLPTGPPRSNTSTSISAASIAGSIAAPASPQTTSRFTPAFCAPA